MKRLLKYMFFALALPAWGAASAEGSVNGLRELCPAGESVTLAAATVIDAVVVSDWRSENMELNPNTNYYTVDREVNARTVYVQDADGGCGVRLVFDEGSENRLARYDRVRLDLGGCRLERTASPDCMTVSGVGALNVVSVAAGAATDIAAKERTIKTLTDDDLYTFVTLRDAEFVFKEGSYTNIWEPYSQYNPELHHYKYDVSSRTDGWATLVRDSEGGAIYMLVNTLCSWRRAGNMLPQGMGPLSGIVVHTPMRRYGGDMGRYSIRPLDAQDIAVSRKKNSPWRRLTGWLPDGSAGASLEFELLGTQVGLDKEGKSGDRVLNDAGNTRGLFWSDGGGYIHVDADYNALDTSNKGYVRHGSILVKTPASGWYRWDNMGSVVGTNAFYISFPTRKAQGTHLQVAFEWVAGNLDGNFSWNFPLEWRVEYSIDGGEFVPLDDAATGLDRIVLRSLPWWDKKIDGSGNKNVLRTPFDAGLGLQQRVVSLPAEAFGRNEVVVRITPASTLLSQIRSNPAHDVLIPTSVAQKHNNHMTVIRFGSITVDYK